MTNKDKIVLRARIAEAAERYDDMAKAMKEVTELGVTLNSEERNLFSVAYKNLVGARRSSLKIISSIEQNCQYSEEELAMVKKYREDVEQELQSICNEVLALLNDHLVPKSELTEGAEDSESGVLFLKMKGDYCRYLAEVAEGPKKNEIIEESQKSYKQAFDISEKTLSSTHPIRLGLALNFSLFYHEILNTPDKACQLARKAFDDAMAALDGIKEESYKDSTLIMQLLRDNLTVWTSDAPEEA